MMMRGSLSVQLVLISICAMVAASPVPAPDTQLADNLNVDWIKRDNQIADLLGTDWIKRDIQLADNLE
ncbi:hypothetical protein DL96DRAFT_1710793 [Flagelloscypha sp. PMI_526]|nr:hypothetical protein DL96DRAFT_1710793 [Flagelloscypha sp. PMI_526]